MQRHCAPVASLMVSISREAQGDWAQVRAARGPACTPRDGSWPARLVGSVVVHPSLAIFILTRTRGFGVSAAEGRGLLQSAAGSRIIDA